LLADPKQRETHLGIYGLTHALEYPRDPRSVGNLGDGTEIPVTLFQRFLLRMGLKEELQEPLSEEEEA
jgi:hypothetical protein